ncbi:MAG: cupin [Rhodospirillaceae bacterium]|nr:cupin [Rhodospirillaceae bacterium]|tara:strand:+ start:304 stop:828 length:525 start_codon:yes stop_codon:yes gene_type:complete
MARTFRRVVTGHNDAGRSIIWKDGPSPQAIEPLPGLFLHEYWETTAPADNTGGTDTAIRENSIEPHDPNGTIFRVVDFPPDEMWKDADVGAAFDEMGSGAAHDDGANTPGMHETQTTDFAIVLEGEIWAVMEEGETMLKAGDVLVQRGTNHAWSNRSDENAAVAFVLVGAKPRS